MRHRSKKVTLDRTARQRRPLLRNLAISLVMHGRITTTGAKARAIRPMVERLVTVAKTPTLTARRRIIAALNNPNAAHQLLTIYGPKYAERRGGYLRLLSLGRRIGDNAEKVMIEFV